MRIAAGFDKGAHRVRRLGLAQQQAVDAAAEDLAKLPGVEADIGGVGAVDRRLDDDRRRAVTGAGRAALDQARHVFGEPGHVERAMLHPDIDVIGPGVGVVAPLRAGQHMPAMAADVVDRLVLRQQLDRPVDPLSHDVSSRTPARGAVDRRALAVIVRARRAGVAEWQTRQT